MPRAKTGVAHLRKRNRIMKRAKGFVLGRSRLYRPARETLVRAGVYAYRDRRDRTRDFRRLWITRLSAALAELSRRTRITQAEYLREGVAYVLTRYAKGGTQK